MWGDIMKKYIVILLSIVIILVIAVAVLLLVYKYNNDNINNNNSNLGFIEPMYSKFEMFSKKLDENNIKYELKEIKDNLNGEEKCNSYLIDNQTLIYLYKFNVNSNDYKLVKSSKKIKIDNKDFLAEFNSDAVLVYTNSEQENTKINNIFNNL